MALTQVAAGARIVISHANQYYELLKGVTGETITLIHNAAASVVIQPSSDPAASTDAIQVKSNAGTVLGAITYDGKFEAADGAVGAPGLTFDDDTDTGIYRVGANDLAITTGGTQRLRINTSGEVLVASQPIILEYNAGNSGTTLTIDWNNGDVQRVAMTGNCTFTFSNPIAGRSYTLVLTQDGTGSRTATWPATVQWAGGAAPTLTTTATTGRDVLTFVYSGGLTKYLGVSALNFA